MFYVQHLLGIGHLKRAASLAEAMSGAGLSVSVVLGGPPVEGIAFDGCGRIALPPARAADAAFSALVDEHGRPVDDAWRDHRQARLLAEFEALRPDILLIEMFPFGRRQFRFELMPLLEAARAAVPRPWIVCSVRDILVRKSATRADEMVRLAATWFDRILVHTDPSVVRLEHSLPEIAAVSERLVHTGYVGDPQARPLRPHDRISGRDEVIVTVGGGAVGEPLLRTALAARPRTRLAGHVWRLICGPNLPAATAADLRWRQDPGIVVERWRDDLPVLLRNSVLSVSQAGYNTVVSVLQARARAVVVPFAAPNETEQADRARAFAKRGLLTVVSLDALAGDAAAKALAAAMDRALTAPRPGDDVDLGGAEATAQVLCDLPATPGTAAGTHGS